MRTSHIRDAVFVGLGVGGYEDIDVPVGGAEEAADDALIEFA